jgi:hypothetical protein
MLRDDVQHPGQAGEVAPVRDSYFRIADGAAVVAGGRQLRLKPIRQHTTRLVAAHEHDEVAAGEFGVGRMRSSREGAGDIDGRDRSRVALNDQRGGSIDLPG